MKILFYRYGSICEDDYIAALKALGLTVIEQKAEMTNKNLLPSEQVELLQKDLETYQPLFVFSINFFPAIAELCRILGVKYVCQTVDCPVLELLSPAIRHETNRIFLFDGMQFSHFQPQNPDRIFHLPLGCNVERYDRVVSSITPQDKEKYSCDISFVGSLYHEKNPLHKLNLSDYDYGYIEGLIAANQNICGFNLFEAGLDTNLVNKIRQADPFFFHLPDGSAKDDRYVAAHAYVGAQAAAKDRVQTLNALATRFETVLYTRSNTDRLQNVILRGGVSTHTEMPKIFHLSRINLNMTIPPIQTGLPLRIFDIMGCGGFLLTNYQPEIPDLFTIGSDLETYTCQEELIEKCDYYLSHEESREKISRNGYQTIKDKHLVTYRVEEMIRQIAKE